MLSLLSILQVGKVAAKCKSFKDYVYKSFKKLGIHTDQVSVLNIYLILTTENSSILMKENYTLKMKN